MGLGAPANNISSDNFSVRWTQTLALEPGVYRFTTTTDDGVRLWVNNQLVIDKWQNQPATSYSVDVSLTGSVPVKMEYFENTNLATARLDIAKIAGAAPGGTTPPAPTLPGWTGTYYNNTSLYGPAAMVRQDPEINFIWGSSSPQPNVVNADRFSVRWTNSHDFPAGRYRFTTYVDGGVRLWVNEQLLIDEWQDPYKTVSHANVIDLPGGAVPLRMEFFDDIGQAEARLVVTAENGGTTAVSSPPPSSSTPTLAPMTAQVVNARALNVRSGPGMDFEPFTYLSRGQIVALTGCRNTGWIEIRLPDGSTGWVGGSYLAGNFSYNALQTCLQG
ncbi:MAG: PA14 domain-containing protein [Chloroflexi bacterium]|nr:PA14 domain-containing protein [Chloroflexota bacterium]